MLFDDKILTVENSSPYNYLLTFQVAIKGHITTNLGNEYLFEGYNDTEHGKIIYNQKINLLQSTDLHAVQIPCIIDDDDTKISKIELYITSSYNYGMGSEIYLIKDEYGSTNDTRVHDILQDTVYNYLLCEGTGLNYNIYSGLELTIYGTLVLDYPN